MESTLDGRTAVVTGASSGIGEATAHALAREGADVVLAARREERLESIAEDLQAGYGVDARGVPTDVRDDAAVDALIEAAVGAFGGLDVLVINAGLARGSDVAEMTTGEYRTMMATNVDGAFFATRAALPHLRERDGHLVFVGSFAGQYPRPFNPVYAATKWWLRGFALSVEASAGPRGAALETSGGRTAEGRRTAGTTGRTRRPRRGGRSSVCSIAGACWLALARVRESRGVCRSAHCFVSPFPLQRCQQLQPVGVLTVASLPTVPGGVAVAPSESGGTKDVGSCVQTETTGSPVRRVELQDDRLVPEELLDCRAESLAADAGGLVATEGEVTESVAGGTVDADGAGVDPV